MSQSPHPRYVQYTVGLRADRTWRLFLKSGRTTAMTGRNVTNPLTLALCSTLLLVLLAAPAAAAMQNQKKTSAPQGSAQGKPAGNSQQHAAPAQRPSGGNSGAP